MEGEGVCCCMVARCVCVGPQKDGGERHTMKGAAFVTTPAHVPPCCTMAMG